MTDAPSAERSNPHVEPTPPRPPTFAMQMHDLHDATCPDGEGWRGPGASWCIGLSNCDSARDILTMRVEYVPSYEGDDTNEFWNLIHLSMRDVKTLHAFLGLVLSHE